LPISIKVANAQAHSARTSGMERHRPVINGVGDKADMGGTRDLRGDPQPQQQDRLNQHAEHRFAAGTDAGKRAAGVQARNRKEEAGDGEQVDKRDQIAQAPAAKPPSPPAARWRWSASRPPSQTASGGRPSLRHPADALAEQFEEIAVLLQHARPGGYASARATRVMPDSSGAAANSTSA
jgi:hypothetical protein